MRGMSKTKPLFQQTFFVRNRQNLRKLVHASHPDNLIVVTANGLLQKSADNAYGFQQDSSFWYLTGISEPDVTLVMRADEEFLVVPGRSTSREAFDGAVDIAQLSTTSGIREIVTEEDGWARLKQLLIASGQVATPQAAEPYLEQYGMYTNPARARLMSKMQELLPAVEVQDIRMELARLRMIKQVPELEAIKQAIDITSQSLIKLTARPRFDYYQNEYEIEADLSREFRFRGASGHAFAPIIAGGKRACTLHNIRNEAPLQNDSLVVLDVGAEVSHYAADITRTITHGKPTQRQQDIFDAVLEVQSYAMDLIKPGMLMKTFEQSVATRMSDVLQRLGLTTHDDADATRKYFPHATSHFLGLDVHDAGLYDEPLAAGCVITCEPGIYVPEEGIGVRLEDDILITETGNENLSASLPKTLL